MKKKQHFLTRWLVFLSLLLTTSCHFSEADVIIKSFSPEHGTGGSILTIRGSGFSSINNENKVTIAGIGAIVYKASDTSLTIIIPLKAGTGPVSITFNEKQAFGPSVFTYDYVAVALILAGDSTTAGDTDGQGSLAQFNHPSGICCDNKGNLYVADADNNAIRKISPTGLVSVVAGNDSSAYGDNPLNATFEFPVGVCIDTKGNLFVTDKRNNRIRKINPAGLVSTFAGGDTYGFADGPARIARFNGPEGICIDTSGNLYVSDEGNNKIRKVSPNGMVTTIAGDGSYGYADGPGAAASFNGPGGICIDNENNLFVIDSRNALVRKINLTNKTVATLVTDSLKGPDYTSAFGVSAVPAGICLDHDGNLFISDYNNHTLQKMTRTGILIEKLQLHSPFGYTGGAGDVELPLTEKPPGKIADLQFSGPAGGLCGDAQGNLYMADYGYNIIRKISFQ